MPTRCLRLSRARSIKMVRSSSRCGLAINLLGSLRFGPPSSASSDRSPKPEPIFASAMNPCPSRSSPGLWATALSRRTAISSSCAWSETTRPELGPFVVIVPASPTARWRWTGEATFQLVQCTNAKEQAGDHPNDKPRSNASVEIADESADQCPHKGAQGAEHGNEGIHHVEPHERRVDIWVHEHRLSN